MSRPELVHAVNYCILMELLGYSQAKLYDLSARFDELIYSDEPLISRGAVTHRFRDFNEDHVIEAFRRVRAAFEEVDPNWFSIVSARNQHYPELLRTVYRAPQMLFVRGDVSLFARPSVSVVGSRKVSEMGLARAKTVSFSLVENGYTVVSGLAKGVDTAAHKATIYAGGSTIAVIGTPISQYYPKENAQLQEEIGTNHLLVSQFPLQQPGSRFNFPIRNGTMCGLSLATIIVEASETSGALYQAKACLKENRLLFVMKSLLDNRELKWPRQFVDDGAIPLESVDSLMYHLEKRRSEQHLRWMAPEQLTIYPQTNWLIT